MSERPPIHSVRVHLGDMGRELLHLEGDMERSDWLLGFHAGASGKMPREGWSQARDDGFHFGACAFAEAVEYREGKSRAGSKSAEVRRESRGTAQPPNKPRTEHRTSPEQNLEQNLEQLSNSVRTAFEQCSSGTDGTSRTSPEQNLEQLSNNVRAVEQRSNNARTEHRTTLEQSLEQLSNQPTAYSLQPTASSPEPKKPAASDIQGVTLPHCAPDPLPPVQTPAGWPTKAERRAKRRAGWFEEQGAPVDVSVRPGKLQFLSYARAVHPQWQEAKAREAFDLWALRGWKHDGCPIGNWTALLDAWADNADQTEYGEYHQMGGIVQSMGISDSLSARSAGITTGERI